MRLSDSLTGFCTTSHTWAASCYGLGAGFLRGCATTWFNAQTSKQFFTQSSDRHLCRGSPCTSLQLTRSNPPTAMTSS